MLNRILKTALGNKRIYCFINRKFSHKVIISSYDKFLGQLSQSRGS